MDTLSPVADLLGEKPLIQQIDFHIDALRDVIAKMEEEGYVCTTEEAVIKTMLDAQAALQKYLADEQDRDLLAQHLKDRGFTREDIDRAIWLAPNGELTTLPPSIWRPEWFKEKTQHEQPTKT